MKNRTDKILLAFFLLSLPVCAFLLLTYLGIIDFHIDLGWRTIRNWLAATSHVVPAFCLQLLLCRKVRRWIAALPGLVVIGAVLWSAYGLFTATGWDGLGYALLLVLCIAPAAGIALAWAVYGIDRLRKRRSPL